MRAVVVSAVLAIAAADCGWTHSCGPRGCPDCKDDGSAGYRECCGGGPGPSPGPSPGPGGCGWTHTCGPRGCPDCKDDGSAGYRKCCGGGPGPSPGPSPGPGSAGTTRYWDCSGGACGGWQENCPQQCPPPPWSDHWVCMPMRAAPRAINYQGARIFTTSAAGDPIWAGGSGCGKCFLLTAANGVKMVTQVNNQCPGNSNPTCKSAHFDIAAPGFDYAGASVSNCCGDGKGCDTRMPGSHHCSGIPIASCDCNAVSSDPTARTGCNVFKNSGWGDNPQVSYQQVACPGEEYFIEFNATGVVV